MKLRTQIEIKPFENPIDYSQIGVSIGSCFAENIAQKLQRLKFPIVSNPFGVMYNPASVADTIERLASGKEFAETDLLSQDDLWTSFYCHGSFAAVSPQEVLEALNCSLKKGSRALAKAQYVIITFGSAWVYELSAAYPRQGNLYRIGEGFEAGGVVANCHKFPPQAFVRRRMSVEEIVKRYTKLISEELNDKQIVMTVSPVRHVKDGLAENNASKSILRLAIDELTASHENVHYFPAFEIMNDDLRDYRFYANDLVHPSELALNYIWQLFSEAVITQSALEVSKQVERIVSAAEHRPINPQSESHRQFLSSMLRRSEYLQKQYPEIDLSVELQYFNNDDQKAK